MSTIASTRTQDVIRELAVTAVATSMAALILFLSLRGLVPDPPLGGSACPASLEQQALVDCISAWPESHHARSDHRLNTLLTVVLGTVIVGMVLSRTRLRLRDFSLELALAMAAGFFAPYGVLLACIGERSGWGYFMGTGLFAAAAVLGGRRYEWRRYVAAAFVGACLLVIVGLVWFGFFFRGTG